MHRASALRNFSRAFAVCLALAAAASAQQVELLEFTSDSCPACVQMEPVVRNLAAAGEPVQRVDVNREHELTARFRVEYLPTFIAVADGREIERHVGGTSPEHLRQMLHKARGTAVQAEPTARGQSPDQQPAGRSIPAQPVAASAPQQAAVSDDDLIASTVRLRVEDPQGISYGTGTIISASAGEAIILTCGHLFRESEGKLPVQVEMFEPNAAAPRVASVIEGEVISYDLVRDLGFVRIRPDRPLSARPVAERQTSLQTGEKVTSVGCDNGKQPSVWRTRLTAINRYVGPANVEAAGTPVQGRSGGGLFSERGELIGVCFAADEKGNEGLYVGIPAIYEELDRLSLGSAPASDRVAAAPQTASPAPIVNHALAVADALPGDSNSVLGGTAGQLVSVPEAGQPSAPRQPQQSFTAEEQAALEEIGRRSGGGEVIVIIRPKSPGDRCEIFSLDSPSQEFLNQLTALGSRATHPRFTTHKEVPVRQASAAAARPQSAAKPRTASRRGIAGWSAVE